MKSLIKPSLRFSLFCVSFFPNFSLKIWKSVKKKTVAFFEKKKKWTFRAILARIKKEKKKSWRIEFTNLCLLVSLVFFSWPDYLISSNIKIQRDVLRLSDGTKARCSEDKQILKELARESMGTVKPPWAWPQTSWSWINVESTLF